MFKVEELSRRKLTENFEEVTYSSRARMSRQSTSLATMTPSTHMLRLTTSTPGNRWLHHCTFRSEKHVRACCRFVTRKRESLFQGAVNQFQQVQETLQLDVTKAKIWRRVRQQSVQDHFGKWGRTIARRSKNLDPATWVQSGSCRE